MVKSISSKTQTEEIFIYDQRLSQPFTVFNLNPITKMKKLHEDPNSGDPLNLDLENLIGNKKPGPRDKIYSTIQQRTSNYREIEIENSNQL